MGRLDWLQGKVVASVWETPRTKTITLSFPEGISFFAGQHVDVRLTAEDGYQAQRSYSIASAPEESPYLRLTIEFLEDGEVSTYLVDELREGDLLEVRGPIGRYFIWEEQMGGPLFCIAGGSGIVPLMSILRHHRAIQSIIPFRLLFSVRSPEEVIYRQELEQLTSTFAGFEFIPTYTRSTPEGWTGYARRVDQAMLAEMLHGQRDPLVYICGPTSFVEAVAEALVSLGLPVERIMTERFGATGP